MLMYGTTKVGICGYIHAVSAIDSGRLRLRN
jgi:hypothetical protein